MDSLEKQLRRIVTRESERVAREETAKAQRVFDRLLYEHSGKSYEELVPIVRKAFADAGLKPTGDDVERTASATSIGERTVLEPEVRIRW